MNQLLNILNVLCRLQNSIYAPDRDDSELLELYKAVLGIVNDKQGYIQKSECMVNSLTENCLSEELEKQWLNYAGSIFASYMAVKLYEDDSKGETPFSPQELEQILEFYQQGNFLPEVVSMGIYSCAQQLKYEDPMRCYELTKTAFSINPNLAGILGITYRFEGSDTNESITKVCPFCGTSGRELIPYYCAPQVLKLKNNSAFPPAKLWMKCNHCGNYFTYNFPKKSIGINNGHYTKERAADTLQNKFRLENYNLIFNTFKKLTSGKEYLEIGIGTGEMLAVALEFGYHVEAVEICREDCERVSQALGIDIQWGDITEYESEKQYDVIVMGDVLEHVIYPVKVLEKVKRMLADDGILWISTPNYNCAYARMQKFSHCMWHEVNHYTYVSYETLKNLLENMQLNIVHYDMSSRYIGSMELFIRHNHLNGIESQRDRRHMCIDTEN